MPPDWEIWLDEHISPVIAKWMKEYTGWNVRSAYSLNMKNMPDHDVFKIARQTGNVIIISKDTDFPELVNKLGSPPKLVYLKIGNCDNRVLWHFIKPHIRLLNCLPKLT